MTEHLCPAHKCATVEGLCVGCLEEAAEGVVLVEMGVAAARSWARATRERAELVGRW